MPVWGLSSIVFAYQGLWWHQSLCFMIEYLETNILDLRPPCTVVLDDTVKIPNLEHGPKLQLAHNQFYCILLWIKKIISSCKIIYNQNWVVFKEFSGCYNLGPMFQVRYFYAVLLLYKMILKIIRFALLWKFAIFDGPFVYKAKLQIRVVNFILHFSKLRHIMHTMSSVQKCVYCKVSLQKKLVIFSFSISS